MEVEKALVPLTEWKKHKQQQTGSWQPPDYVNNTTPENITEPKQSAFQRTVQRHMEYTKINLLNKVTEWLHVYIMRFILL